MKKKAFPLIALLLSVSSLSCTQESERELHTVEVNGGLIEYQEHGSSSGEPVLLIHGTFVADTFLPLVQEEALQEYRLIRVHLRNYSGSSRIEAPFGVPQNAQDMIALLDSLGIERAHFVGHSYGANISLQAALDSPARVHTLTLLEGGATDPWQDAALAEASEAEQAAAQSLQNQGSESSNSRTQNTEESTDPAARQMQVDMFLTFTFGGKETLDIVPGAYEQALDSGFDAFAVQAQATGIDGAGSFDPEVHLPALTPPILLLGGDEGMFGWQILASFLTRHYDRAESHIIEGGNHAFHMQKPREVAEQIAGFLVRNQM